MTFEYRESQYKALMCSLTASNIHRSDIPETFLRNLDDSVRNPVELGVEKPIRPIEYQWIARRGLLWLPELPRAYIMANGNSELRISTSSAWREGVAAIVWVDESGGYRIASFGLAHWTDRALGQLLDESIVAINKQRAARQAAVDEMARQEKLNEAS